jgi:gliding motility associated protien GldN
MKNYKNLLLFLGIMLLGEVAEAQRTRRTTQNRTRRTNTNTRTRTPRTNQRAAAAPTTPAVTPPATPVDTTPSFKSLRHDRSYGIDSSNDIKDRNPLEYEFYRKDDQVFATRLWEEIDLREKMNQSFIYKGLDDNGPGSFINILINIVKGSRDPRKSKTPIQIFSDDRFVTAVDDAGLNSQLGGTTQTITFAKPDGTTGTRVISTPFNPDEIKTFRIKGDWVFDKESSVLKYRLLGIAPIRTYDPSGTGVEISIPMFWIYYPDIRADLAKYDVYNPKNMGQPMTWEELFESRYFNTYVVKSSMDNPLDYRLKDIYSTSTILQLYEGQRIKDKIFDYEQNLWSY